MLRSVGYESVDVLFIMGNDGESLSDENDKMIFYDSRVC